MSVPAFNLCTFEVVKDSNGFQNCCATRVRKHFYLVLKRYRLSVFPIEIDILYTLEEALIIEFYCLLVHER